jgi:hypothetical protein
MGLEDKIIGVLFGILLGSLLTSAGYLYKSRIDRIKIVRGTIFCLLKTFHLVCATKNMEILSRLYAQKAQRYCYEKGYPKLDRNSTLEMDKLISKLMNSLIDPIWHQLDGDFTVDFNNSLIELSKINPVLAYNFTLTLHKI